MRSLSSFGVFTVLVTLGASAGCARDIQTHYPAITPSTVTGSVTLRLTKAARNVTMTVNGVLAADAKHTQKVTIDGVPAGYAEVMIAIGGGGQTRVEKTLRVVVQPGRNTTIPVASPGMSTASAIYWGLYLLGDWIFLASVYAVILL